MQDINTALIHDWLPVFSGAEFVLSEISRIVGPSDLYTLYNFLHPDEAAKLKCKNITTSYLNRLPFVENYYRWTFPLCPTAIEHFDLSAYDLLISSSAAFAKGVIVHPHQRHIAYIHTPVRYAWDQTFEYQATTKISRFPASLLLRRLLSDIRIWDVRTAHGPDLMIANSNVVKRRIEQVYNRCAVVIHPPVQTDRFELCDTKEDYFITASRFVPYKRMDLVIDAFNELPNQKLLVLGDGPDMNKLKSRAKSNIIFKGYVARLELEEAIRKARAFVFAGYEDFGIVMAEAQAAGTPVIAYQKGGAQDIVVPLGQPNPTGVLFGKQDVGSVLNAIKDFIAHEAQIDRKSCSENAQRFSVASFTEKMKIAIGLTMQAGLSREACCSEVERRILSYDSQK